MATNKQQKKIIIEAIVSELRPHFEAASLVVTRYAAHLCSYRIRQRGGYFGGKELGITKLEPGGRFCLCHACDPSISISLARPDSLEVIKQIYIYCASSNFNCRGGCPARVTGGY